MILDRFRLDGKVALVTGAARGLGQGIAVGLAEAGADVAVVDILDPHETVDMILALGRRGIGLQHDLGTPSPELAATLIAEVALHLGRVDILVNNAGIIRRNPALDYPASDWEATVNLNLSAAFYLSQAVGRYAVAHSRPAKIINLCSLLSFQGGLTVPAYTAAKSGLAGLTRALANEWASKHINVNAIAPGYMETEFTAALRSDATRGPSMLARIPAGRWGTAQDVKGPVVFLASEAAEYIHGIIVPVDGGWMAW